MAKNYQADTVKWLTENKPAIENWLRWRPTTTKGYDELLSDVESGVLKYNPIADDKWENYRAQNILNQNTGAWYEPVKNTINFPESKWKDVMGHEIMHHTASHWPGEYGVPKKISPYVKADMKYKGWLPSIHPGGRRPTMSGKGRFSDWWNQNMATKNVEYSDEAGYHPWFDEHAFDKFGKLQGKKKRLKGAKLTPKEKKMAQDNWYLGKNVGVPAGTWKSMGKKLGFGLSEQEKVDRQRARRISRGRATRQEQLERVSGRLNEQGQYGEYDIVNPGQARYANQYAAQQRAAGRMSLGPSGKPLAEWTSDEVKEMQRNLNAGGYVDAKGEQLKVDGMVGAKTVAAMRSVQQADFGDDMGPRGDYSEERSGIGAGEEAIRGGARGGIYGTGDKYIPGGAATPEDFDPSIRESAGTVLGSYGNWMQGEEGWIPDILQRQWRERRR